MWIGRQKRLGMFVVWLKDAKLQNLLSGRKANIQVTVKVAFTQRLRTVTPSSFGNRQHDFA